MSQAIINRVIIEANYIIKTKQTIRQLARYFNISKSTIHKDLNDRLIDINTHLYKEVKAILKEHIETRHIKGGEATKKKYLKNI